MVPLDLVGLAIGTEGANINKSRQIKGVVDVKTKKKADGYSFTVFGEVCNHMILFQYVYNSGETINICKYFILILTMFRKYQI